MKRIIAALAVFLATLTPSGAASTAFKPLAGAILNPERGFFSGINDDFLGTTPDEIASLRSQGITLIYALVRLDAFRTGDIPAATLARFEQKLALVRQAGLKVTLRFAYNNPANEFQYQTAKDAPLAIVRRHIAQLAPVIARNRGLITVLQTGFIGAWGEGHTSSNHLDTPANKQAVISALLAAMPKDIEIQWRYPPDLFRWQDMKLPGVGRVGLHNDCFLSSPTDVGTYSENATTRAAERKRAAQISAWRFYSGETCGAEPGNIRASCADILREGPQFHVSSLNRDYYEGFINSWVAGGCFPAVARQMGYRLRLVSASLDGAGTVRVVIHNDGWARPVSHRPFWLVWRNASGQSLRTKLQSATAYTISPGTSLTLTAKIGAAGHDFCVAAPDPLIPADGRYAIRFANANNSATEQSWEANPGQFCFRM